MTSTSPTAMTSAPPTVLTASQSSENEISRSEEEVLSPVPISKSTGGANSTHATRKPTLNEPFSAIEYVEDDASPTGAVSSISATVSASQTLDSTTKRASDSSTVSSLSSASAYADDDDVAKESELIPNHSKAPVSGVPCTICKSEHPPKKQLATYIPANIPVPKDSPIVIDLTEDSDEEPTPPATIEEVSNNKNLSQKRFTASSSKKRKQSESFISDPASQTDESPIRGYKRSKTSRRNLGSGFTDPLLGKIERLSENNKKAMVLLEETRRELEGLTDNILLRG